MKNHAQNLILAMALMGLAACSSKPADIKNAEDKAHPNVPQTSIEAKQVAAEQEAPYVTEVTFKKGSAELTPEAKQRLEAMFQRIHQAHSVDEIKVVTWADEEYPSTSTKSLSKKEKDIAENRNKELKKYLSNKDSDMKVSTYNMAERPNAFEDFLGTTDTRIKKSLESAGIPTTDSKGKKTAKASKSIVMLIMKE
jgi:outer membrane protein OmpA-like peptidoglycan-associated protein